MIKLIFSLPDGVLLTHELTESRITVGSGVGNTLVIPHETVAESHLDLVPDTSGYLVADLVGGGVTTINGHPIEPGLYYQLETGTQIQLGAVEAVYIASQPEESHGVAVVAEAVESAPEEAFEAAGHAGSSGPAPIRFGAFPVPKHPPGLFTPLKTRRSLWVLGSCAVTAVAVVAAVYVGYLSTTIVAP